MTKVAIVTGASRGIGAATALLAAAKGYHVAVNYLHSEQAANDIVANIVDAGGRAIAIQGDTGAESDIVRMFETVDRELGPITSLVNNAGIAQTIMRLETMDEARLARTWAVNITGYFLCAREAIRRMSTANGGAGGTIVNVSSAAARLGGPGEWIDYAASKGAIDTMTLGLAKEVGAEGVRINAVRPGLIETDIHATAGAPERVERLVSGVPMQRSGTAHEVAESILWLMEPESSYVTGALVDIGGGR
ncbi:MAG: SDR family oxidoreductase [Gammaproteobacteria bacterium]|nr:SDR family oxidoreductase [Gammaproteobacteria bacterium]